MQGKYLLHLNLTISQCLLSKYIRVKHCTRIFVIEVTDI